MGRPIERLEVRSRALFLEHCQRAPDKVLKEVVRWLRAGDIDDGPLLDAVDNERLAYNIPNTTVWLYLRPLRSPDGTRVWTIHWWRPIDPADATTTPDQPLDPTG